MAQSKSPASNQIAANIQIATPASKRMCKLNNGGPPLPRPHTQLKIYRTETLNIFTIDQLHSKNHAVQKQNAFFPKS